MALQTYSSQTYQYRDVYLKKRFVGIFSYKSSEKFASSSNICVSIFAYNF